MKRNLAEKSSNVVNLLDEPWSLGAIRSCTVSLTLLFKDVCGDQQFLFRLTLFAVDQLTSDIFSSRITKSLNLQSASIISRRFLATRAELAFSFGQYGVI